MPSASVKLSDRFFPGKGIFQLTDYPGEAAKAMNHTVLSRMIKILITPSKAIPERNSAAILSIKMLRR
jgi:hypothetical protein